MTQFATAASSVFRLNRMPDSDGIESGKSYAQSSSFSFSRPRNVSRPVPGNDGNGGLKWNVTVQQFRGFVGQPHPRAVCSSKPTLEQMIEGWAELLKHAGQILLNDSADPLPA